MKSLCIPITSNTYISSKYPAKNFSNDLDLICENESSKHINIILLKFPLKELKNIDVCTIDSVELCFHYNFLNTEQINIFNNIEDFNSSTVTWCTAPFASKNSLKSFGVKDIDGNLISFNITALVLSLISTSKTTYGVQIVPSSNNSALVFSSSRTDVKPFIRILLKKTHSETPFNFNSIIEDNYYNKLTYTTPPDAIENNRYSDYIERKPKPNCDDCSEIKDNCNRHIDFNPIVVQSNDLIPICNFDINVNPNLSLDCKNQQIIIRTPGEYLAIWVLNCYSQSSSNTPIIYLKDCLNKTLGKSGVISCGGGELTGVATFSVDCSSTPYSLKLINKSSCSIEILTAINNENKKYYFSGSFTIVKLHC